MHSAATPQNNEVLRQRRSPCVKRADDSVNRCCDNLLSVDIGSRHRREYPRRGLRCPSRLPNGTGHRVTFGVVTSFVYHLHAVGPEVMLCVVAHPLGASPSVLRSVRDFHAQRAGRIQLADLYSQTYIWSRWEFT
jgi:hypothetical protein